VSKFKTRKYAYSVVVASERTHATHLVGGALRDLVGVEHAVRAAVPRGVDAGGVAAVLRLRAEVGVDAAL